MIALEDTYFTMAAKSDQVCIIYVPNLITLYIPNV